MKNYLKNNLKSLIIFTAALSLFWANFAEAGFIDYIAHIGSTVVTETLAVILFLIGYIAGQFVFLGGTLTNWALDLNSQIINNQTVSIGWVVSRDIANLGFVLALILIAFATILRIENYQMKQILWKLIVAALLVNFSLVMAGVFIDFSGVLTNFFISKATNYNASQLGAGLANALQTSKILDITKDERKIKEGVEGMKEDLNKQISFVASQFFVAVFTTIVAISLLALAAMLYIRYVYLTILLILMPIVWLLWIWPDVSGQWTKWWNEFLRWVFFAPALSFFLYLALSIRSSGGFPVNGLDALQTTIENFGPLVGQMLSVIGILIGGLYVANQMGIAGADMALKLAKAAPGMIAGTTVGLAGGAAGLGLRGLSSGLTIRGKTVDEQLKAMTERFSGTPFIGGAMQRANRALTAGATERMDKYQKDYGGMTKDARLNAIKDPTLLSEEKRAALMGSIAQNGEIGDLKKLVGSGQISQAKYESFAKAAIDRGGNGAKAVISGDPLMARFKVKLNRTDPKYDSEVESEIAKAFGSLKPEAAATLDIKILQANPAYLAQLRGAALTALAERSFEDKQQLKGIIEYNLAEAKGGRLDQVTGEKLNSIAKFINQSPAWAGSTIDIEKSGVGAGGERIATKEESNPPKASDFAL